MQNDFVSSFESINSSAVDAVKRLGEIQLRTLERLTETQIEATSHYMSESVKQLQTLAGTKDLQAAVTSQSKYISDLNENMVGNAKKVAGILTETREDLTKWVESEMKTATDRPVAKAATKKSPRAAA